MNVTALFPILIAGSLFAAPARHPSYEPDPPTPALGGPQNLFLNAKTTAKDHWSDRTPALAVNGKTTPDNHWASDTLPSWHRIDLEKIQTLSTIRIIPYWPDGRIYQFHIEASTDGQTWITLADQRANSINTGPSGFTFTFDPTPARHIRTTFTGNTANNAGHIVAIEGYAAKIDPAAITLHPGQRWKRYHRDQPADLAGAPTAITLRGWKGERVNAIAVAQSPESFKELIIEPCTLTGPKGEQIPVKVDIIRYTLANGNLTPDILDGTTQTTFKGITRPLFISIDIPPAAPPAAHGTLTLHINGNTRTLPITLKVDDLTLPPPPQWVSHIDIWQHPHAVARWHDVPPWSPQHLALMKPGLKHLAGIGQKTITATLIDEAWNSQTYDRFPSMIQWIKNPDGTFTYDYTAFDTWVSFMISEIGINSQISCYTMLPWTLTFPYYDKTLNRTISPRLQPGTPQYEAHWGPFLTDFTTHLRQKGWLGIATIAIDERPDNQIKPALAILKKYAPQLRITSACNAPSAINEEFHDVSYIFTHAEKAAALAAQRRAQGKKTTYYVCVHPFRPNTFLVSDLAESEWFPTMAAHYGFDGILRWAYQSWVENPLHTTDYTAFPTGDTALIYPGDRSSLRLEYLRDGIETLEKFHILRTIATPQQRAPIEKAIQAFTVKRGGTPGIHASDLIPLHTALDHVADNLAK